jgi:HSP20 family protein
MLTFGLRRFGDARDALRALDLIDRRFDDVYGDWSALVPQRAWPVINGFETKEAFVYKADVPGLTEADLSVAVEDGALVLKGERKVVNPEGAQVHLREQQVASFTRKVALPGRVEAGGVTATLKDGVLTVTLPKASDTLPRQIPVKVG